MTDDQPRWREFPDSLQEIFEGLWQETVSLHAHWELYFDLYGDPKKIRILNATVPSVFQLIEENLRANMTVSFGRLTDPSKTGKKDNLSLARLVESLPAHCDDDLYVPPINGSSIFNLNANQSRPTVTDASHTTTSLPPSTITKTRYPVLVNRELPRRSR